MEPGGETAGVIGIERIAIGRNERRGKTGVLGSGMELGEMVFFFGVIERIATGGKNNGFSGYEQ